VNDLKVVLDRDLRVEIALLSAVDKNLLRCIFFPRALDARYVYQATFSLTSLRTKVRVFSDIFRPRKTKVAHFTL